MNPPAHSHTPAKLIDSNVILDVVIELLGLHRCVPSTVAVSL